MDTDILARGITPVDDRPRTAQSFRKDLYDATRHTTNHDTNYASDQGPGPATVDTTPPRALQRPRPRFVPHSISRTAQQRSDCLTAEQTIDLFTKKIEEARKETQHVFSGPDDVSDALKPTLTIDLGRARIERLPDAIIDLIIADVERLSLSHNMLRYMPSRIAACKQLRYLNIRSNDFRELPPSIYQMPLLEILDVSKNKISNIPPEIKKLECLRVFAIVQNRLQDLPVELTELPRLKVLKLADNPFKKHIVKVFEKKEGEVAYSEMLENERDAAMTTEIMKYLKKLKPSSASTPVVDNGDSNEPQSAVEPMRPRRALSGRFPVVPATISSDPISDSGETTPQQSKPPSLPAKSHLRGLSGQSSTATVQKRPGIAPIVNGNERNRSNSESVLQASATAATARQRRMGVARKEQLDSIDEGPQGKQIHARGFSHGSVLRRKDSLSFPGAASSSPSSPRDVRNDRVARLSSLPEHRTGQLRRPIVEGAKGILYAIYQVQPHISGLIMASEGRNSRKTNLGMSFYNACGQIDKLNKSLSDAQQLNPGDEESWERAEEMINTDTAVCIKSFMHVTTQMQESTRNIVKDADPRYVRSLMLMLYGSVVEVKNAIKSFGIEVKHHRRQMSSGTTHPIATIPEEPVPETPRSANQDIDDMTERPVRFRSDTVLKVPTLKEPILQPVQPPSLQIPHLPAPVLNGTYSRSQSAMGSSSSRKFAARSRSDSRGTTLTMNSQAPSAASTPGSAESYQLPPMASLNGRASSETRMTDEQEERRFEQIFMALTKAYEIALQAVPITMQQLERCLNAAANDQRQTKNVVDAWNGLVQKSRTCLDLTQALQIRLTNMKLKDSGVGLSNAEGGRHDPSFWVLCKSFLSTFVDLVTEMKEVRKSRVLVLPQEAVGVLRPVQKAFQDAGHAITTSPWNHLLQGVNPMPAPTPLASRGGEHISRPQYNRSATVANSNVSSYAAAIAQQQIHQAQYAQPQRTQLQPPPSLSASSTPALQPTSGFNGAVSPLSATSSMPATPLSAALGPAAQATVPSTPASLYGDSFFKGDVFQRADSLLNMPQAAGVNFLSNRR
ncbi:RAM signaling network component [Knufia obscura]|uniref:RAM signaling network component n=2 Tax=Knufia TaxID=430999 RepID=A0AAN8EGP6_9EURO|nr:RAM signaling network component [Knufia obscura]KAK5953695.1 RAM signaling network component [Knufia fluminis]